MKTCLFVLSTVLCSCATTSIDRGEHGLAPEGNGAPKGGAPSTAGDAGAGGSPSAPPQVPCEGFVCSQGKYVFTDLCRGSVRCDPATSGVECVNEGESCPVLDAGVDVDAYDARPAEQPAVCVLSSESTIPGVHIEFPSQPCAFTLAQASRGVRFSYDVVIDDDVPGYSSRSSSSGVLVYPGSEVAKLQVATVIEGGTSRYCVCDQGGPPPFCTLQDGGFSYEAPTDAGCGPITLEKGVSHVTWPSLVWGPGPIDWHGRSWNGPSDTGEPEGAPFPPGDYELKISIAGRLARDGGTVDVGASARLLVRLVP